MTGRFARAGALVALILTTACGPTVVEEANADTETSGAGAAVTLPPVALDAPLDDLLTEIELLMLDLDERIIDEDRHVERLERIDELWAVASEQIRDDDPADVFNFAQAIELARTGVERRRPADASKGYKILADVIDAYLER